MDSTTVAALCSPAAVPMTMPATSPIAQPVRQCRVACAAVDHGTDRQPAETVVLEAVSCGRNSPIPTAGGVAEQHGQNAGPHLPTVQAMRGSFTTALASATRRRPAISQGPGCATQCALGVH